MIRANHEDEGKIKIGSTTIEIDPAFNPYRYAVQSGTIAYCPMKVDRDFVYDIELFPGDLVFFHHFVVSPETAQTVNNELLYAAKYRDLYCVIRDNKIISLQDYVFLSPVKEDESTCKNSLGLWIKPAPDNIPLVGRVEATCKEAEKMGIKVGDHVRYLRNSDYDLKINNKVYYRMKAKRIIALVDITSETVS